MIAEHGGGVNGGGNGSSGDTKLEVVSCQVGDGWWQQL
jgi:hypothetical protein